MRLGDPEVHRFAQFIYVNADGAGQPSILNRMGKAYLYGRRVFVNPGTDGKGRSGKLYLSGMSVPPYEVFSTGVVHPAQLLEESEG